MAKRTRPKGYAPWRPQSHSLAVIDAAREILRDHRDYLPLTIRQVFYRLVAAYNYPKDQDAYNRLLDKLTRARRAGLIPFEHLRDDTLSAIKYQHYASLEEFYAHVRRQGEDFTIDKLAAQGVNIRVHCEAAGMLPQLVRTCEPLSVPVYSCSGFDSVTAKYELAQACAQAFTYQGRATVVLHLGDLDPSGVSIYESMRADVLAFLARDVPHKAPEEVAIFERVALTRPDVELFDLPTYRAKGNDTLSEQWRARGLMTCQLEALPPETLAAMLEEKIGGRLDLGTLGRALQEEEQGRREASRALPPAG